MLSAILFTVSILGSSSPYIPEDATQSKAFHALCATIPNWTNLINFHIPYTYYGLAPDIGEPILLNKALERCRLGRFIFRSDPLILFHATYSILPPHNESVQQPSTPLADC